MSGLRERWRVKAMHTIQERALDLFDEKGFSAVTIDEIAAAAEVSPSTVYRLFGTKEGIIVADEFDTLSAEEIEAMVDPRDPIASLLRSVRSDEAADEPDTKDTTDAAGPWRRIRYHFTEPSVRMAACASADRTAQRLTPLIASTGRLTDTQARVAANALAFGYFAALEQWYLDGGTRPVADYVEDGLRPLRGIWPAGETSA
ncbi:TetR/AcrR family transcriptional regulator [Nocardia cyriacigeorgica]|uniref:TetR/AcrR family transcriptional regulator n=1 Tax=Nocardia cyriacigeorgica TaxID=135487 RepID=UPI001894A8E5|nr:TetR/AcrR family transcriptional regulator [Nocardia cyriacigeorgica]MBF6436673.1 helix-turn-helix transcriptional regulator [Nocardia cyriacigeorgica]MBF6452242.1 helix-turn-helix transcriptional regulator [Nocardia cyriacigeorgica]MBF6478186.1 helix-turn-helix transcriptional regulator [Nocardia cyriacigeorgica]MBF6549411.1 helix-turn-helix transcriptional regulator [Nocardia cyriacigeorgica]